MNRTLGPRNLGDILSETFAIYKSNFLRLIAIVAIVSVPVAVLSLIVNLLFPAYGGGTTEVLSNGIFSLLLGLASFVAYIIMQGAMIHAISEQYFSQPVNIGRAYSFAWRRTGDIFWALVLAGLAIGGILAAATLISVIIAAAVGKISEFLIVWAVGGIIGFAAAIYLGITWTFIWQTALLESCGPTAALSHSSRLVKQSWWRVLGIVLLLLIIVMTINMLLLTPALIGIAIEATTGFMPWPTTGPPGWTMIAVTIGNAIGNIICIPIFMTCMTLLYFDLRVRKQGYSLDALANELGLRSTSTDTAAIPSE